ncbi:MAG: hypothetical protein JNN05_07910 [Candidatus Omnitrophica bacterium]|nr:hypothetical protein [Candidatus Omnitrophota bacterium]
MKRAKRKLIGQRQDYSEEILYPDAQQRQDWEEKPDDLGGIYSASEIGGQDKSQLNPWQGTQEEAKAEP